LEEEVDLLVEDDQGRIVAIEVKTARSVSPSDAAGIRRFRDSYGERFLRGFVIHPGDVVLPLGDRVWALPVSALWTIGERVAELNPVFETRLTAAIDRTRQSERLLDHSDVRARVVEFTGVVSRSNKRLTRIADALRGLGVKVNGHTLSEPSTHDPLKTNPEPDDVIEHVSTKYALLVGTRAVGQLTVEVNVTSRHIESLLTVDGLIGDLFSDRLVLGWNAVTDVAVDEHYGRLADVIPAIVNAYRRVSSTSP
jgi:hypothetical protein